MVLITKAMQNQLIIPQFEAFCDTITEIYEKCKVLDEGTIKHQKYLPSEDGLREKWGVSICTVDGQRFSLGDSDEAFPIQSTATPITYGLCLEELGEELVHKYQGHRQI